LLDSEADCAAVVPRAIDLCNQLARRETGTCSRRKVSHNSKRSDVPLIPAAVEALGGLDVLVNNAGITGPTAPVRRGPRPLGGGHERQHKRYVQRDATCDSTPELLLLASYAVLAWHCCCAAYPERSCLLLAEERALACIARAPFNEWLPSVRGSFPSRSGAHRHNGLIPCAFQFGTCTAPEYLKQIVLEAAYGVTSNEQ
jgi:hypothetical protein